MPENNRTWKPVLILGAGYVGRFVYELQAEQGNFYVTSRRGRADGCGSTQFPFLFDLSRPETWHVVERFDSIIWTFPAAQEQSDIARSIEFFDSMALHQKNVMILGSTSCFKVFLPGGLVDESCSLDLSQPRVVAEEELRKKSAFILCLSGIYGPGRDPCRWLLNGLVQHAASFINLIHISDILEIVKRWQERSDLAGARLIASDGRIRRWNELVDQLKSASMIPSDFQLEEMLSKEGPNSKQISNEKLKATLYSGPFHLFPEEGL